MKNTKNMKTMKNKKNQQSRNIYKGGMGPSSSIRRLARENYQASPRPHPHLPNQINLPGLLNPTGGLLDLNDKESFTKLIEVLEKYKSDDIDDDDMANEVLDLWLIEMLHYIEEISNEEAIELTSDLLGSGTYGKVYDSTYKGPDGKSAVLKLLKYTNVGEANSGVSSAVSNIQSVSSVSSDLKIENTKSEVSSKSNSSETVLSDGDEPDTGKRCEFLLNFLKETIIQFIMSNSYRPNNSAKSDPIIPGRKPNMPLAPSIYKIFYIVDDEMTNKCTYGIIMEKLDSDLHHLVTREFFADKTLESYQVLMDISEIVKYAQEYWGMSHRDLKLDNIMYNEKDKRIDTYFIDFGMSCINSYTGGLPRYPDSISHNKWDEGVKINCIALDFYEKSLCNDPVRDLTQLSFNIDDNYKNYFPDIIGSFCTENINHVLEVSTKNAEAIKNQINGTLDSPALTAKMRTSSVKMSEWEHSDYISYLEAGITKSALDDMDMGGWNEVYRYLSQEGVSIINERCNVSNFQANLNKIKKKIDAQKKSDTVRKGKGGRISRKKYIKNKKNNTKKI